MAKQRLYSLSCPQLAGSKNRNYEACLQIVHHWLKSRPHDTLLGCHAWDVAGLQMTVSKPHLPRSTSVVGQDSLAAPGHAVQQTSAQATLLLQQSCVEAAFLAVVRQGNPWAKQRLRCPESSANQAFGYQMGQALCYAWVTGGRLGRIFARVNPACSCLWASSNQAAEETSCLEQTALPPLATATSAATGHLRNDFGCVATGSLSEIRHCQERVSRLHRSGVVRTFLRCKGATLAPAVKSTSERPAGYLSCWESPVEHLQRNQIQALSAPRNHLLEKHESAVVKKKVQAVSASEPEHCTAEKPVATCTRALRRSCRYCSGSESWPLGSHVRT
mmetsp:Transcript_31025/g.59942  ORF Transcript_31025/g.59942 Transcript_31025/m.59942 type:complete len:332 (-) Transcript_31025:584-1579(-)